MFCKDVLSGVVTICSLIQPTPPQSPNCISISICSPAQIRILSTLPVSSSTSQNSLASASSRLAVIAPVQAPPLWSRLLYKFLRSLSLYPLQPPPPINPVRLTYAKNSDPDTSFSSFKENHHYFSLFFKGNFKLL